MWFTQLIFYDLKRLPTPMKKALRLAEPFSS